MKTQSCHFSISDFPLHCSSLLESAFSKSDYHDVTLISDDEKFIKTHKLVLAGNSEYFRNILQTLNNQQQPFIVLKGINHDILESLIKFMYFGKTSLSQNSVSRFVETANFLKIRGLIEEPEVEGIEENHQAHKEDNNVDESQETIPEDITEPENDIQQIQDILLAKQSEPIEIVLEDEDEKEDQENKDATIDDLEDDIVELVESADIEAQGDTEEVESHYCDKCDFESAQADEYAEHIRTEHVNDIKCKECDHYVPDLLSLKEHMMNTHDGISCNNCRQRFSDLTLLRRHVLSNDDCMSKLLN